MPKRKQLAMWVVRSSYAGTRSLYLFPEKPHLSEDYCYDWVGPGENEGGEVCYKHWLAATGLSLKKDRPVRVAFTAKVVK